MKLTSFLFVFLLSASSFAYTDIQCDLNQSFTLQTPSGSTVFTSAEFTMTSIDNEGTILSVSIQDRFGPAYEMLYTLFTDNSCSSDRICMRTDISPIAGIHFSIPKEAFKPQVRFFTIRIRNNHERRTYFPTCRKY